MIIIGSRGSSLALAQTGWVKTQISGRFPDAEVTIKVITTSADRNPTASIRAGSSVGVFVKELEQALLQKEIDIAVHSMKDVPTSIPEGLQIAAVPEREDARDAFIAASARDLSQLPPGSLVGTGSVRRQAQLLALRPDLRVADIRGNVDTRLKKLQDGSYDSIILACAGLNRLGLHDRITFPLDFAQMLPSPGQGALAIEIRTEDVQAQQVTSALNHAPTEAAVSAERSFLRRMGGGCNVPVAVYAHLNRGLMEIDALVASPDGKEILRDSVQQKPEMADEAAIQLAESLLARGARSILEKIYLAGFMWDGTPT
jgi:hydroxymethylbilane synthase